VLIKLRFFFFFRLSLNDKLVIDMNKMLMLKTKSNLVDKNEKY